MKRRSYAEYRSALLRCTAAERERLLAALLEALEPREGILLAYVYGSFAEGLPFHDIDVGIYLAKRWEGEDAWFDVKLARELELAVSQANVVCRPGSRKVNKAWIPVDVRVLNGAPVAFSYQVLRGRLLFSRAEAVRVPWVARILTRYLDLKPLRHGALKEAMTSWA